MRHGHADLPLHYGQVPPWLHERMSRLGVAIVESILLHYGKAAFLQKISDPFWFQSLGCVLGMDWHSSGITTSVLGALKKAVNPRSGELGIYFCGGKGKHSRNTPAELLQIAEKTGLNGTELVRSSRLAAKVDNTAVQDGFQLYLHSFILSDDGDWAVVQQGMNESSGMARRYHWSSQSLLSFLETPHTSVIGENIGPILNLTDTEAQATKTGIVSLAGTPPHKLMTEIKRLVLPRHHEVRSGDVDLRRLGATIALAQETEVNDMESLLLLKGVGPRTIQSLTLVSEVIHGTPSRFSDPARFSFAHGGKDGHPFPVPVKIYDETIETLRNALQEARIGNSEKSHAIMKLNQMAQQLEKNFIPNERFNELIERERNESWKNGGRTVHGAAKQRTKTRGVQLKLF